MVLQPYSIHSKTYAYVKEMPLVPTLSPQGTSVALPSPCALRWDGQNVPAYPNQARTGPVSIWTKLDPG